MTPPPARRHNRRWTRHTLTPADQGSGAPAPSTAGERTFRQLLVSSLISGVTSSLRWFALTLWVYLETLSVVVTVVIAGAYRIPAAVLGAAFPAATLVFVAGR